MVTHLPEAHLLEKKKRHLICARVLRKVRLQGSRVSYTERSSSMKYICIHTLFLPMLSNTEQFLSCGKCLGKLEVVRWQAVGEMMWKGCFRYCPCHVGWRTFLSSVPMSSSVKRKGRIGDFAITLCAWVMLILRKVKLTFSVEDPFSQQLC